MTTRPRLRYQTGVQRAERKRTNASDPRVLKQCAQRPLEVHLNAPAPAASKCASKLREDCIFQKFSFFFFSVANKNLS